MKRIKLFDCYIDNLTMRDTVERVGKFILSKIPHQHVVVNVNKIILAHKDKKLRSIINQCDLINVDGMPLVWVSRLLGKPLRERVAGIDLFHKLLEQAHIKKWRVYFLGADVHIIETLIQKVKRMYPNLIIAGYHHGFWHESEEVILVKMIREASADILFVGIPSPKKEFFLNHYLRELNIPFVMGVGGSFDVMAGKVKRAPLWMQQRGGEWFYRFLNEPQRLFRRYFIEGFYFIYLMMKEISSQTKNQ